MGTGLPGQVPERKRRAEPQPEAAGRAPLCDDCWHLKDSLGHVWICLSKRWRTWKRPARGGAAA